MKICTEHWAQLRADISKYGLDHLIAPGQAAVDMLKRQIEGTEGALDFDPLMAANFQLMDTALSFVGLRMMEGAKCPPCELRDYNWTEGAAYQSRLYAEKHGLLLDLGQPKEEK